MTYNERLQDRPYYHPLPEAVYSRGRLAMRKNMESSVEGFSELVGGILEEIQPPKKKMILVKNNNELFTKQIEEVVEVIEDV